VREQLCYTVGASWIKGGLFCLRNRLHLTEHL
jgi:hypothetical protein